MNALYSTARRLLFQLDAEQAHHLTFAAINYLLSQDSVQNLARQQFVQPPTHLRSEVMGLSFPNPVGLAAGFDKNALLLHAWEHLGFGFVEIGTVTPRPQAGNPKPRLFRLKEDNALINRMGFNNDGVATIAARLQDKPDTLIVGANIGKNKDTPNEQAVNDYTICFERLADLADYFVVNVSSPNTPGLRALQDKEPLMHLLAHLQNLNVKRQTPKPILVKVAPDLTAQQQVEIAEIVAETGLAGIVATNTTISRNALKTPADQVEAIGAGGLSGQPLTHVSKEFVRNMRSLLPTGAVIIGAGGIMNPADALAMHAAGANLVQVYSGYVYAGPWLVPAINKAFAAQLAEL